MARKSKNMATFGVTDTFGLTAPTGFLQSSEKTQEVETATIKNAIGQIAEAQAKPRQKTTVTVRCKGTAVLSTVPAGQSFSTLTITSSKFSETNDDFPTSEITGTLFE
jgi:hypothetical protein